MGVEEYFAHLLHPKVGFSIREYVKYLQELSNHYHDNIPINQSNFITLLVEIIKEYLSKASDVPPLAENETTEAKDEAFKNLTYQYLSQ
ncbi:MAG: hypothetical protein LBP53_02565 [Candidatus Peribacteria bacterium]|jgi:hypothetical protein|nr:hypothetical protein [Candidatus Peribacteria bacterium]